MALYVIGLTPEWVEFRESREPPKAVKSQVTRTVRVPSDWPNSARGKLEERTVTFKRVTYEGGRVVGTVERSAILGRVKVSTGECVLVESTHLTPTWRKAHGIL